MSKVPILDRWPFPAVGPRCAARARIYELNHPVALAAATKTTAADDSVDEPSDPGPTAALSIEQQGWDEWEEEQHRNEWHAPG